MEYKIHRNLHTNFSIFEENKLPERSYFIPFSSAAALADTDYKNERYRSDRVTALRGEWDFAYFEKLSAVPEVFDTNCAQFDKITVPCTWQRTGYDQIAYINTRYPFPKKPPHIPADVAVGIYRKTVSIQNADRRRTLSFLGVAGALAVYVNGAYVGYSEGSHNTAEFDITAPVNDGENEIVAVVYKWSNGTYLECQDMFRENGIFRDVLLTEFADSYINDFTLRSAKNSDGTYDLTISVEGQFKENTKIEIRSTEDAPVISAVLLPETSTTLSNLTVNEWSAEIPNLYEITVVLFQDGKEAEAFRTYYGFKTVEIQGEVFRFNGKAIKMKGVNHHDTHMTRGYAMSLADLELDVQLMKAYNCNTVRTSHYPPDPAFLTMCDVYGLYVVDEADIETHGFYAVPYSTYNPNRLSNDTRWASHYLDRVKRMYGRDKNHPSITMWSLGNESGGYKCQDVCYEYLKKVNPEIPVHYEGANRSKRWAYDVVSHMYARPDLMRKVLAGKAGEKYKGKPFFQCEYAHAMGNGPGGLEEYMQLFYSSDQFMGGCIWEWADHSVYDENAKYKWTYGGDHNEPIHDGNFCVDGLFFPDRTPSSGALEMKACYRPIRAKRLEGNRFVLWNTRSFADSSDLQINYTVTVDGVQTDAGSVSEVIPAESKKEIEIRSESFKETKKDVFVNFVYTDKQSGAELATEQVVISAATLPTADNGTDSAEIQTAQGEIRVQFQNGSALFDCKKGLVSYQKNGTEYLNTKPYDGENGFVPHIYRGMLDNDRNTVIFWNVIGLSSAKAKLTACKVQTENGRQFVRTTYNFVTRGIFVLARAQVDYAFDKNGKITVRTGLRKVCPLTAQLPRFGVHAELKKDFEAVTYYGRGPEENYSDFCEHAPIGVYETTVTDMPHKYIKPQDSGNRGEVRYSKLTNEMGAGLKFTALETPMNFNANHFTLGQLNKAAHIEDLPDVDTTFTALDGFVRGTGSGSCGPIPSKEHLIDFGYSKPLQFSFTVEPFQV